MEKEKAFVELHNLIIFYMENRDLPIPKDFDFYKELQENCEVLGLDVEKIKKEFKLF